MLANALNFAGTLTFRKLWNILIVWLSYQASNLLKKPIVWGKPWFVSIEPASVCNLSCPQCPVGTGDINRENKYMRLEEYQKLILEMYGTTLVLSLYFQGEPLMHSKFNEFVKFATEHRIYTQTSTNGQLLTEEVCRGLLQAGLDRIIVSLDGINQESYQTYRRGGEFQKVEKGIRILNRLRREMGSKKPYLVLQFLVFRHNREQLTELKRLKQQWGVDKIWIKSAQVEYPESAGQWISGIPDKYSRYEKLPSGEWGLKGKLKNRCKRLWQTTVITSDAIVVPCCFDKRAEFPMGDSREKDIVQIWKSKEYRNFRKRVISNRKQVAMCTNCTEGIGRIYLNK